MSNQSKQPANQMAMVASPEWRAALRELAWDCRMSMASLIRLAVSELAAKNGRMMPRI